MPITLVSHYTLRNIPWEVLISKCLSPWCKQLDRQCRWPLLERVRKFLQADGLCQQQQYEYSEGIIRSILNQEHTEEIPLDFLGLDRNFNQKDGSVVNLRFMATRLPEGNIQADIFTTLDLAYGGKMEGTYLSLHHQLQEFSTEDSATCPKLHFGEIPQSVYLRGARGALWDRIARNETNLRISIVEQSVGEQSTKEQLPEEHSLQEQSAADNSTLECSSDQYPAIQHSPTEYFPNDYSPNEYSAGDYSASDYSKLQERIKELEESLEETLCENNALSDRLEESQRLNREQQNGKKTLIKSNNELKDKIDRLKKRMKQADKRANMNADEKFTKFCEDFDKENDELRAACAKIQDERDCLQLKLQEAEGKVISLKGRLGKASNGMSGGLLTAPSENEKFEDEFVIAIFSAIHKAIEKTPSKSNSYGNRSIDLWTAIIKANPDAERAFQNYKELKADLMNAMKSNDLERNLDLFAPLGMKYSSHTNNHWKFNFADGDRRYNATHASTPSETSSGPSNSAKDLKNAFLYPT